MEYVMRQEELWLRFILSGKMTQADMAMIATESSRMEAGLACIPNRLVDLSGLERFDIKFADVFELARERRVRQYPNHFKSALVATTAEQQGFARMFQTLNDNPKVTIAVFDSVAAAETWLREG
jgi:hypothetical protein